MFWSITPEVEFYFLFVLVWAATSRYLARFDIAGLALLTFGALVLMSYRDVFPGTFVGSKLHYFLFGVIAGIIRSRIRMRRGTDQRQIAQSVAWRIDRCDGGRRRSNSDRVRIIGDAFRG